MCDSKNIVFLLLYSLTALLGCSCSPCSTIAESQQTVRMADSLRVHEGVAYDDSVALAEAYSTPGCWRWIYPDDYARACYYYGRMLRNRGDQVAAMKVFISGSHAPYVQRIIPIPWFSDYHILGRIYSNMGTMCHLIDEFELGYDMYEQSAEAFHTAGDTTAYFYALSDMALELAEQKLHHETLALIDSIEQECRNTGVLTKLWETKAILYENLASYDSAIIAANVLYSRGYYAPTGYVIEAQAYWHLQQYDSALYYANVVMTHPNAAQQDRFNMLHIIIYNDSTASYEESLRRTEERSDIDKEILDPLKERLAQAVTVLRQDSIKRPHYLCLVLFILLFCIIGGLEGLSAYRIKSKREQTMSEINTESQQVQAFVSAKLEEKEQLNIQLTARQQQIFQDIETTCELLRQYDNWDKELRWKDYKELCDFTNHHFYLLAHKLQSVYQLDEKEVRLCVLVLLDKFNNDSLAKILHYGKGIRTYKSRLNAKLGNKGNDLRTKLIQIAVSSSKSSST